MGYNNTKNMKTMKTMKISPISVLDLLPTEIKGMIMKDVSAHSKLVFDLSLDKTKVRTLTEREKYNIVLEEFVREYMGEEYYMDNEKDYSKFEREEDRDFNCYEGFEYLDDYLDDSYNLTDEGFYDRLDERC
jgi:hypothetical protein